MLKISGAVLAGLLLFSCDRGLPTKNDAVARLILTISWNKDGTTVAPDDIDSVRISLQSSYLSSDRVSIFPFLNGKGKIEELPSGIDVSVTVDGLGVSGEVLYSGQTSVPEIATGEVNVSVVSSFVGLRDTLGPTLAILSHRNPDTVGSRVVRIFGRAADTSGIFQLMVADSTVLCNDFFWDVQGTMLNNGKNVIRITATDNSRLKNTTTQELVLYYDPAYVKNANHAPYFLVSSATLGATLKAGTVYSRVLYAADPDSFNRLAFRVGPPLQLTGDSCVTWLPGIADTGRHLVYALVFDQDSARDSVPWFITVVDSAVNTPPMFQTRAQDMTQEAVAGSVYMDTVKAVDLDQATGLIYSIVSGGIGMLIDSVSGVVAWIPKISDFGVHYVTIKVKDDSVAMATLSWVIDVKDPSLIAFSAGHDTTVTIKDTVDLKPYIIVKSGTIIKYEWDIGNTGSFIRVSQPETSIIVPRTSMEAYVCVLKITNSNGDIVEDHVSIRVLQGNPKADAGVDSIVAPGKQVYLTGKGTDGGRIIRSEWDIGNTGHFVECLGFTDSFYMPDTVFSYSCVLRVMDDDSNTATDMVTFRVLKIKMALIEPAAFTMGSLTGQDDEKPVHTVTLSPFYMDTTEVTQKQFYDVLGFKPSRSPEVWTLPVESVTWYDAVLYCNALSKLQGMDTVYSYGRKDGLAGKNCTGLDNLTLHYSRLGFRLPTEAEWEYACRAGAATDYFWGDDNSLARTFAIYGGGYTAMPYNAASRAPNALGLYDMAGNVWEWCNDWYGPYSQDSAQDPKGSVAGATRVIRGGSWQDNVVDLRSAHRGVGQPGWATSMVGFRTVLQVK
ncbi:MAG: formylglycine-generating enzyme family protein [Fibrobacterota bacterium]